MLVASDSGDTSQAADRDVELGVLLPIVVERAVSIVNQNGGSFRDAVDKSADGFTAHSKGHSIASPNLKLGLRYVSRR